MKIVALSSFFLLTSFTSCKSIKNNSEIKEFGPKDYNQGIYSEEAQTLAREASAAFKSQGICELPLNKTYVSELGISNHTDLLHHFLCLADKESLFNRTPDGVGGNGLIGINKVHFKSNGLCPGMNANLVKKDINKNIECAFRLYNRSGKQGGLHAWGKPGSAPWGSNRSCGKVRRDAYKFSFEC